MANIRIDGMPTNPSLGRTDTIHTSQGGKDYKATVNDVLLFHEPETQNLADTDSVVVGDRPINVSVDVSVGDADIQGLSNGTYEGQTIHIIASGSGIVKLAGGNGLYANGIYITENTGGLHLEWTNGKWVATNEVTADYIDGVQTINQRPTGALEISSSFSKTGTSSYIGLYAVPFLDKPAVSLGIESNISGSFARMSAASSSNVGFNMDSNISNTSINFSFNAKGKY